jgi:nitrogen fixation/metabolism regulation signal transduction histidine kinase
MPSREARKVMAGWVAAIADNVKNPIASIGAVLDQVETRVHDQKFVDASIAQIRRRLASLNDYVSELADFARPAVIRRSAVKLKTLANGAVEAAQLPETCLLRVEIEDDTTFDADSAKLTLVLSALLKNAFEAVSVERYPSVRLAASTTSDTITVTVEDNGPGLDPSAAARALEPFYTTKEAGTGLGLAVAHKYVEAHGGTITIDRSKDLGGCRVTLRIPLRIPARSPA